MFKVSFKLQKPPCHKWSDIIVNMLILGQFRNLLVSCTIFTIILFALKLLLSLCGRFPLPKKKQQQTWKKGGLPLRESPLFLCCIQLCLTNMFWIAQYIAANNFLGLVWLRSWLWYAILKQLVFTQTFLGKTTTRKQIITTNKVLEALFVVFRQQDKQNTMGVQE